MARKAKPKKSPAKKRRTKKRALTTWDVKPALGLVEVTKEDRRKEPKIQPKWLGATGVYTDEIASIILTRMSDGETLAKICRSDGMPTATTVRKWAREKEEFGKEYAIAVRLQNDALADEMLDIADNVEIGETITETEGEEGNTTKTVRADMTKHREMRINARQWRLEKIDPRYSNKVDVKNQTDIRVVEVKHIYVDVGDVPPEELG